jgi:hypothetical protein
VRWDQSWEAMEEEEEAEAEAAAAEAGAYTRPLFGSTQAHFVGYVESMNFPQSIRQGDTVSCDRNGSI